MNCLSSRLTRSAFPLFGLIWHVGLYSLLHSSTTILMGVYLPAHKLPLWRQCDRHWHTLTQPFIGLKLSPFFSTLWHWQCRPRLGPHIGGWTWQCSPKVYTYPRSAPLGSIWTDLCLWWPSQLWLLSAWHASWKSAFCQTTIPNTLGLYRALSASPLGRRRGDWTDEWRINSTASVFVLVGLSPADLIQRVIADTPRLWMTVICVNGQVCCNFHGMVQSYGKTLHIAVTLRIAVTLCRNFLHLVTLSLTALVTLYSPRWCYMSVPTFIVWICSTLSILLQY